ncbi:bifunctional 4-hydroxy-2-oxoglutarate aldolase/2-dehydro-3-deoxy-phosphogluconate aldolase [Atopomonas sediminilitoris]|uniref:bifunctional 4-hydroxy-2-oxoglutarate aldolase/2-dehydro-3-deoxy-phosphogluconate aldolase n=1 Tax=Atopomonas sediminilitoris TaxID=2919919 RepID=UPI001F4D3850|nr:bifunctional 4-hydroxy-2-oxoglutarate aldolase/2-dehydro-3-deoxy-phosphogluconate aldolase [Atopomonas sediminilitoris]MCJ8169220.1 bifunctional 4-hydroxy-2-oxoglutarate aldolase/2-dehydro-3-deoxy-phosphogluconate aldolase [Atopomonas sediminilitoris]
MSLADNTARLDLICSAARIMPVIVINQEADILPLADALAAGGLRTLEITLRSAHGLTAIRLLREQRPELCVGAGTVLDVAMYQAAEQAGAQFVVTPGCTQALLEYGARSAAPLLPGISTASELMQGYALGYRRFKLFPAEVVGGQSALKAFAGPFRDVRFCPTGGVKPDNANAYLALSNVMCIGGTWMLPDNLVAAGDWSDIERLSREALALVS